MERINLMFVNSIVLDRTFCRFHFPPQEQGRTCNESMVASSLIMTMHTTLALAWFVISSMSLYK